MQRKNPRSALYRQNVLRPKIHTLGHFYIFLISYANTTQVWFYSRTLASITIHHIHFKLIPMFS
jgi:hypothetical protein